MVTRENTEIIRMCCNNFFTYEQNNFKHVMLKKNHALSGNDY